MMRRTRMRIMSDENPMNRMFVRELSSKGNADGRRSEMVKVDVDEEGDFRLDLMSATRRSR